MTTLVTEITLREDLAIAADKRGDRDMARYHYGLRSGLIIALTLADTHAGPEGDSDAR